MCYHVCVHVCCSTTSAVASVILHIRHNLRCRRSRISSSSGSMQLSYSRLALSCTAAELGVCICIALRCVVSNIMYSMSYQPSTGMSTPTRATLASPPTVTGSPMTLQQHSDLMARPCTQHSGCHSQTQHQRTAACMSYLGEGLTGCGRTRWVNDLPDLLPFTWSP